MRKWQRRLGISLFVILSGPALVGVSGAIDLGLDWRTASRESTGLAPTPEQTTEAVIQVYAARAFSWRGLFAVHTWIATKAENADHYIVHQVLGWNLWYGHSVVDSTRHLPDRRWYGAEPSVVADIRGPHAARLIGAVESAVTRYPYADEYTLWPGPNSNTFVAFVAREVPELKLSLPVTAIGKDFLGTNTFLAAAPSGTGKQVSLAGALGILVATVEGLEVNVLGLVFGVDVRRPALKLPGIGRLGFSPKI
jgi:hypothetical protein